MHVSTVIHEGRVEEVIRLVFGENLKVDREQVGPSPNLGGQTVTFYTSRGHVMLLDTDGQLLLGFFYASGQSTATPTVSTEVAAANAQRVIDRVFPWAAIFTRQAALNDHGAYVDFDITWRETVAGVQMPSWANATTTSSGEVMVFCGNRFNIEAPPAIAVDQEAAVGIALATLPPLTTLKSARLQMGMLRGEMRTFWHLYLWTSSPPGFTGYRHMPGRLLNVDAITGDVLPL